MFHLAQFKNEGSSKKRSVVGSSYLDSQLQFIGVSRLFARHFSKSRGGFCFGRAEVGQFEALLVRVQLVSHPKVEVVKSHALENCQNLRRSRNYGISLFLIADAKRWARRD
jgi:hypothetical protein